MPDFFNSGAPRLFLPKIHANTAKVFSSIFDTICKRQVETWFVIVAHRRKCTHKHCLYLTLD